MSRRCGYCLVRSMLDKKFKAPKFETDQDWYEHMENQHGVIVIRIGETQDQAVERCAKKGISINTKDCQCEDCKEKRKKGAPLIRYPLFLDLNKKGKHVRSQKNSVAPKDPNHQ